MKAIARAKTWHRVLAASVALTAVCGFSETPDYFVEWVQPSAALHVDTGVRGKVGVKAEVQFIHRSSPTFPVLLGSWGGNKKRFNLVMHWNEQGRWEYGDQMNNLGGFPWYGLLTTVSVEVPANGAMSCTWTNTEGGSMNHTMNATATYGLLDTETTLTLFASHYKDASSESFNQPHLGRLYYCKLWEGDTGAWTLSRDFRPCVKDGVAGLYDSVEGVIHYPAGNVLVAGPVAYDTIATWNGGTTPTAAELATASNWTCTDKNGDSVASAVPDKATLVVFPAGIGSVTLPDGYIAPWGAVRADGSVAHPATQYGTYTKGRDFVIIPAYGYGTSDTKGYFTQDGGTVEIGGAATIGRTGIGHYTMTGGRLHATGNFYVGHSWSGNNAGDGLFSISGDAVAELDKGIILGNNRTPGTLALSGGTLFTPSIKKGSNTATVTFDGGTVVATNVTDGANFITGLNNVTYGPGVWCYCQCRRHLLGWQGKSDWRQQGDVLHQPRREQAAVRQRDARVLDDHYHAQGVDEDVLPRQGLWELSRVHLQQKQRFGRFGPGRCTERRYVHGHGNARCQHSLLPRVHVEAERQRRYGNQGVLLQRHNRRTRGQFHPDPHGSTRSSSSRSAWGIPSGTIPTPTRTTTKCACGAGHFPRTPLRSARRRVRTRRRRTSRRLWPCLPLTATSPSPPA